MKGKRKPVEAWGIVDKDGDVRATGPLRNVVNLYVKEGERLAFLSESNPKTDAVVRAAVAWWRAVERWKAAERDDSPRPMRPIVKAADRAENNFWRVVDRYLKERK